VSVQSYWMKKALKQIFIYPDKSQINLFVASKILFSIFTVKEQIDSDCCEYLPQFDVIPPIAYRELHK
jgi:hypothetical protein